MSFQECIYEPSNDSSAYQSYNRWLHCAQPVLTATPTSLHVDAITNPGIDSIPDDNLYIHTPPLTTGTEIDL